MTCRAGPASVGLSGSAAPLAVNKSPSAAFKRIGSVYYRLCRSSSAFNLHSPRHRLHVVGVLSVRVYSASLGIPGSMQGSCQVWYNGLGVRAVSFSNPKQMTPSMRRPSKRPRKPHSVVSPASLPLPDQGEASSAPASELSPKKDVIKPGGDAHKKALKAAAMRLAGHGSEAIAAALEMTVGSLRNLMYRAGRQGLIDWDSPKEELEGVLWPAALQNMKAFLDDEKNPDRQERATFKVHDGMVKALYADRGGDPAQMVTMIGIKIEPVPGAAPVRAGMIGGAPAYVDGETV